MTSLVLVADDDPDILGLVQLRLERAGLEVVTAPDGEAAWSLAQERVPAVCVLDVSMPRLDGLSLVRRLRADDRFAATKLLVLTAAAATTDADRAADAGADAYVRKPFSPRALVAAVQDLL